MKANLLTSSLIAAALFILGVGIRDGREDVDTAIPAEPAAAMRVTPVTLPQILVVPTAQERAEALLDEVVDQYGRLVGRDSLALGGNEGGGGSVLTPRMNFDMPYYSFGKVLPRVSGK